MKALGAYIFAGGFTVGVNHHFDVVAHLEGNDYGVSTAKLNWPDLDIRYPKEKWQVEDEKFRDLDFIYCNPPCAIFSMMGVRTTRGKDAWRTDPRTECWHNAFSLLETLRPQAWACESVSEAYTTGREMIDELTRKALALGYSVTHLLHNAHWLGLPQRRKRFFLVVHRAPVLTGWQLNWSPPPTVQDLLAEVHAPGYVRPFRPDLGPALAATPPGKRLAGVWEKLNPDFDSNRNPNGTVKGRPSFQDYRLSLTEPMGAYIGDKIYHPTENRLIGINEAKALCGFPQDFQLAGREGPDQGSLLARGVMPPVAEWLAKAIKATLEGNQSGPQRVTLLDLREPERDPRDLTDQYLDPKTGAIVYPHKEADHVFEETGQLPSDLAQETTTSFVHGPEKPEPAASGSGPARSLTADRDGSRDAASRDGLLTAAGSDDLAAARYPMGDSPAAEEDSGSDCLVEVVPLPESSILDHVSFIVDCPRWDVDRVKEALELTPDPVKVTKVTGLQQSSVEAIIRAMATLIKFTSPAGRPAASPVVRVPVEPVVSASTAADLKEPVIETLRDDTVKPPASGPSPVLPKHEEPVPKAAAPQQTGDRRRTRGVKLEGLDQPLTLLQSFPIPDAGEPSGHFIKRCLIADKWTPEQIVGFVLKSYEGRTTKVGDVYFNYRQLQDANYQGLPPWRGHKKSSSGKSPPSKPLSPEARREQDRKNSAAIRGEKLNSDPFPEDNRPRALLTGSTAMQVGSKKTQLKIITAMESWACALIKLGYAVEWRPVIPGEDLSSYAVVLAGLNKPPSIASSHFFGALWALYTRRDAIAVVDDWQTHDLVSGIHTNAKLRERAFRLFPPPVEHQDRLFEFLKDLDANKPWRWPVIAPLFRGGDSAKLGLPARVVGIDPTVFARRYPKAVHDAPFRQWVQASLHEKKLSGFTWPIYQLGFQDRKKGGSGPRGEKQQDRVPEADLMEIYSASWGIISPPHPHAGSGWWRVRFLMAADACRVLTCSPAEAAVLDGGLGPYTLASMPRAVEKMEDEELLNLASMQAAQLNRVIETEDEVLTKLANLIKERV